MHCTWFFNNTVNQILSNNGAVHTAGVENLLRIDNLDEFVNSGSF